MSERSDEAVREGSVEDVIDETDRLLAGETDAENRDEPTADRDAGRRADDDLGFDLGLEDERTASSAADGADADASGGRFSRLRPSGMGLSRLVPSRLSLSRYFAPKSFLAIAGLLAVGFFLGSAVPLVGQVCGTVGLFLVSFLLGLFTSRRRYVEVATAGVSVGAAAALVSNAVLIVAGSGGRIAAVGAGAGLVACVLGYYFGRDLRAGLSRDV